MEFQVARCVIILGNYALKYSQLIPNEMAANIPSTWKTLQAHFTHPCELEILQNSRDYWCKTQKKC